MTVASISRKNATLYAFNASGKRVWSVQVGPPTSAFGWPHAVTRTAIYVHTLTPHSAVEALDPATGKVLWSKSIGDIQRLAVANDLLFALTYGLGQPVRLAVFKATTGAPVGAVQLSTGYYAFSEANELMIAAGMVFIRAVGPSGSQLLALGL
jgi:outer membrane protein assembly factor BamB